MKKIFDFKFSWKLVLFMIAGIILNIAGKAVVERLQLPLWLDSIGTCLVAFLYGPLPGALIGFISNIIYMTQNPISGAYAIVNVAIAFTVGIVYPKKRDDVFQVFVVAFITALAALIFATPINLAFNGGYLKCLWGDAMFDMLSNYISVKLICSILSQFYIEFPDKIITLLIVTLLIRIIERKKSAGKVLALFLVPVILIQPLSLMAASAGGNSSPKFEQEYLCTTFGVSDGLSSVEINAMAQTPDGYIWAGGYSGLYRYDGNMFSEMFRTNGVNNVMSLHIDENGLLWIGTNDEGVFSYDYRTKEIVGYSSSDGLSSDSVRAIGSDGNGVYVGTTNELDYIDSDGNISVLSGNCESNNVITLTKLGDNSVMAVTNSGKVSLWNKGNFVSAMEDDNSYTTVAAGYGREDACFFADYDCNILTSFATRINDKLVVNSSEFGMINKMMYNSELNCLFICGKKDFGYIPNYGEYVSLARDDFYNDITDMILDIQGNLWFSSQKQGIIKYSKNPFHNVFLDVNADNMVVNACVEKDGILYIGGDDGLVAMDVNTDRRVKNAITEELSGNRIRGITKDSNGTLWFSLYSGNGLLSVEENGTFTYYTDSNGAVDKKFRFTIELSDGTIAAASPLGITFIKDGQIKGTLGEDDGLEMPQILTMIEGRDGYVYAGSDGDGIYIIKDMKLVGKIDGRKGLMTQVVLRIVPYEEGYIYVTSNALYYDNGNQVRKLTHFPYSNNYDIYIDDSGKALVSSSAGLYIVDAKKMIENTDYNYSLINNRRGFDTTLTSNAWNYVDGEGYIYLCCSDGVRKVNIDSLSSVADGFNIILETVVIDGGYKLSIENNECIIPAGINRITINPALLDYTLANPLVHMYLKGFDDTGVTKFHNELTEMSFTNLPAGNYEFHVDIINEQTGEAEISKVVTIIKEPQFYEKMVFKIYTSCVVAFIIVFFTWLFSRFRNLSIINGQYKEIEKAKYEAERANNAKSQFLASMSHEIRTPINTIMGMDELILRENLDDNVRVYAEDIKVASNSLLSIINDILDLSKIESGKMNILYSDYNVKDHLCDIVDVLNINAKQHNLTAKTDIDSDLPMILHCDSLRIRQILLNFISNAAKYTDKGEITLSVKLIAKEDNIAHIRYAVTDTGIGIKEEDMPKLFRSFERLDEERNAKIQGTGLGLSISKSLLDLMDAKLEIKSTYGEGSEFAFEMLQEIIDDTPIGDISHRKNKDSEKKKYRPSFIAPKAKVLAVDDTKMNLLVFKGLLKSTQVSIDTAESGKACLEMIAKEHYDIIFLDHMMPDMDGIETFEIMKKTDHMCKDTPVIILTANAIVGAKDEYLKAGFNDYLSKPVDGTSLEKIMLEYIPKAKIEKCKN